MSDQAEAARDQLAIDDVEKLAAALETVLDNQFSLAAIARQLHQSPNQVRYEIMALKRVLPAIREGIDSTGSPSEAREHSRG